MKQFFTFLLILINGIVQAQIPENYYASAYGEKGRALQVALFQIIDGHQSQSYNGLWSCFYTTDAKSDGTVWDIYSDVPGGTPPYIYNFGEDQCGNYSGEGICYNREHSMPKSWFDDAMPMYTDLFHIYPTDGAVNGRRGNFPYGEVGNATWTSENGSKLGSCSYPGYNGTVFEPIDEYKGDLARTYLYMCTRYMDKSLDIENGATMLVESRFKPWALEMLIRWHEQDTVSKKEIDRNNAIYAIQKNRNPFIDHPELVGKIFGADSVNSFNPVGITHYEKKKFTVAPNPANENITIRSITAVDAQVCILDAQGRELFSYAWSNENELSVDLSRFQSGFYIILINSEKGKEIHKIVKW